MAIAPSFDASGRLAADVACLTCGYNLRGLAPGGACPECGLAVGLSLRTDRLDAAPVVWRATLARGATWLRWGVLAAPLLVYPGLVVATAGFWRLTAAQPGRVEPGRDRVLRLAARVLLSIGLVGICMTLIYAVTQVWPNPLRATRDWRSLDGALIGFHGIYFLGLIAGWDYLATLAERAGDAEMVRRCRRIRWVWIGGVGAGCLMALLVSAAEWLQWRPSWGPTWGAAALLLVTFGLLVWLWFETQDFVRRFDAMIRRATRAAADQSDPSSSSARATA